jgi:hypothetical protein
MLAVFVAALLLMTGVGLASSPAYADDTGLSFNGSSGAVELDTALGAIPTTFEARINVAGRDKRQLIFANYTDGSTNSYQIELDTSNQLRYYELIEGNYIHDLRTPFDIDKGWTSIAVVRDAANGTVTLLQDGVVLRTWTNLTLVTTTGSEMALKHWIGTDNRKMMYFDGSISELRTWSTVRTQQEISDGLTATLTGAEAGLSHLWKLDSSLSTGASVHDLVSDGIDGKLVGYFNYQSPYTGDEGVDFSDGSVEIATDTKLSAAPRTAEAWVKIPANFPAGSRVGVILGNYWSATYPDTSLFSFEIYSNGRPRIFYAGADGTPAGGATFDYTVSSVDLRMGDWVHLAMVLDDTDNTLTTYVNGELAEKIDTAPIPTRIPNDPLKIGGDYRTGNVMNLKGSIADVRVWSSVRTQAEIQASMNELTGSTEGLMGRWQLSDGAQGVYPDTSGNDNTARLYSEWVEADFPEGDYSFAVLPDTQFLAQLYPDKFRSLTGWIRDNADALNIEYTMHLGDIVEVGSNATEWAVAQESMRQLDGVVPYALLPGNHDWGGGTTSLYNQYFPYDTYSQTEDFGGSFPEGSMDNTYHLFTVGKVTYLVLSMAWAPSDAVIDWANEVVAAHPDTTVIVTTHSYMYHTGDLNGPGTRDYASGAANDGTEIWDKLVSQHENIAFAISGHIGYPDLKVRTAEGVNGNTVQQILCDGQYMDSSMGGVGMLMLLTFTEDSDEVAVSWYSTDRDKLYRARNQFTIPAHLTTAGNPNPSGSPVLSLAGPATATTADTIDYTVSLADMSDIAALEVELKPEGNLEYVEATSLHSGLSVASVIERANGNYRVILQELGEGTLSIDADTPIIKLSFKPTGTGEGKLTLIGSEGAIYVQDGSTYGNTEAIEVALPTGAAATVTTTVTQYFDPYDFNRDGAVNIADLAYAQIFYMASEQTGGDRWAHVSERGIDVDASGVVDVADFIIIIEHLYDE